MIILTIGSALFLFTLLIALFVRLSRNIKKQSLDKKIQTIRAASPYSNINPEKNSFSAAADPKPAQRDKIAERLAAKEAAIKRIRQQRGAAAAEQDNDQDLEKLDLEGVVELEKYNSQETKQKPNNISPEPDEMVVDFAPPKGRWTKFVVSSNILKTLATAASINRGTGFWQNFVRLQRTVRNREQDRDQGGPGQSR